MLYEGSVTLWVFLVNIRPTVSLIIEVIVAAPLSYSFILYSEAIVKLKTISENGSSIVNQLFEFNVFK